LRRSNQRDISETTVALDQILSHHFELDGLAEAIKKVRAREDNCLKALIKVAEG